jgi:hypothetical protein
MVLMTNTNRNVDDIEFPTQLYYSTNKVAEILTSIHKDVCKSINDYFNGKFNSADIKDFTDVINGVFIYHKSKIIKDKL